MIIQSISLRDFKSYAGQTIDLNEIDSIGICGPNGAGKSTIIEAVTFGLFGKCTSTERKELGNEAIIRDGQDEAFVSIMFEKDDQEYTVERMVRRKGTGTATLTSAGKMIQAGTATVNTMVQSIVGMDYETFVSSTIIRQDEMDKISDLRPGERKDILSKIFGLEIYDKLKKTTHERLSKAEAEVETAELLQKQLRPLISNEDAIKNELEDAEASSRRLVTEIGKSEQKLNSLEAEIAKAIQKKTTYDVKNAQLLSLEREITSTNSLLTSISKDISAGRDSEKELYRLKKDVGVVTNLELQRLELEGLKEEVATSLLQHEQETRSLKHAIADEKMHYSTIQDSRIAECPVCRRPLDDEHRHRVLEESNSKISQLTNKLDKVTEQSALDRKRLDSELLPKLQLVEEELSKSRNLQVKIAHLEGAVFNLDKLAQSEKDLKSKLKNAEAEKQRLNAELATLDIAHLETFEKERKDTLILLVQLREEKGRAEESAKRLKNQLVQIANAREDIERIKRQTATRVDEISIYGVLEGAFDKDGIPTSIMKSLVPEVEEDASRILYDLSKGEMRIGFKFGRSTKAGTQTDELVMEAEDHTGQHPVTRFSGGERMRINLALRLGISEVIARRSGYKGKIETLIIDEGLSALDEEGRRATFEILRQLRRRFKKILIISHLDDVKDAFETRLVVSKSATGLSIVEIQ